MSKLIPLFLKPKSFFSVILVAFFLVTLPLTMALIAGVFSVDRLFRQSAQAVVQASQAAQRSRLLEEQARDMERSARQFSVLGDAKLLENYTDRHEQFQQGTKELSVLLHDEVLRQHLAALREVENQIYQELVALQAGVPNERVEAYVKQMYDSVSQIAHTISEESDHWIATQVDNLQATAASAQQRLIVQAVALVPGTLVFAIFLSIMVSRPVNQLDQAIRRLGDGRFDAPVTVSGPRDLRYLGERLNWLRQRLTELEEKKSSFLRHVSHELKTPLTVIREGSELLNDGLLGELNKEQQEIAEALRRNTIQLQKMIENLLNFNMIDARKTVLEIDPLRLDLVINDVVADHKVALIAKNIDVQLDLEKIRFVGDREKLRVVVDNLVSNAIKYSPDGGRIHITLQREGAHARLDVTDQGPGIRHADREKIFEAFYRGHSTPNSYIRGSGLGLSIAKEFVTAHHGTISALDSPQGGHFRVVLPFDDEAVSVAA